MLWRGGRRELATLRREGRGLINILCPAVCRLCEDLLPHPGRGMLCRACQATIEPLPTAHCSICALPFATQGGAPHRCEECLRHPPPFELVIAGGLYQGALQMVIQQFKFAGALDFDRYLATVLAQALRQAPPFPPFDMVIPMPLHPHRLRERTYNQARLLAREFTRRRGWRLSEALIRHRATAPQSGLDRSTRQNNMAGAFALRESVDGATILLIDDVLTTGATAREAAATLLGGGATRIVVGVAARAPRHHL